MFDAVLFYTFHCYMFYVTKIESEHDKSDRITYAPSKDTDQPERPLSLISLRCALSG